jgi:UDP-glucose 4-epimerase
MKRIIIFGATGGIGVYTALSLKNDYEIIAVGRRNDNGFFADHGIEYIQCDITKKDDYLKLPKIKYAVINLAAMIPARMNGYEPQQYIDSIMNLNILDYTIGAEKYLYFQSFSDVRYLWSKMPIPADSESRFPENNDHSVYSICKTAAMNLSLHYGTKYGYKCFVIRLPNVYIYHPDPYYYLNGERRWQNYRLMIYKACQGENIEIWNDPRKIRDILYVKDLNEIIKLCIESDKPNTYNAGTGIGTTLEDQVKGIVEVFGGSYSYANNEYQTIEYIMDISKTIISLGYKPKYNYLDYLRDFKNEMELNRFEKLWGKPLQ